MIRVLVAVAVAVATWQRNGFVVHAALRAAMSNTNNDWQPDKHTMQLSYVGGELGQIVAIKLWSFAVMPVTRLAEIWWPLTDRINVLPLSLQSRRTDWQSVYRVGSNPDCMSAAKPHVLNVAISRPLRAHTENGVAVSIV